MRYWVQSATEQFPPSNLIEQAVEAERAGFDAVNVSDHFQPWWEPGESGMAWALLGAIGQATDRAEVGTGVTAPVHRYHPALVAQFAATMEEMCPGRAFLGIGSGESLNESPCGMDWPDAAEQVERMKEALELIGRLLDGERVDHEGRFFRTKDAYLHTRGDRRIEAYRSACDDAGREAGEVILQAGFSWAPDDDSALEGARVWKPTQLDENFTDDHHDPSAMYGKAERQISDDDFKQSYIVGSDPAHHVERIREIEKLGALRTYGKHVLSA